MTESYWTKSEKENPAAHGLCAKTEFDDNGATVMRFFTAIYWRQTEGQLEVRGLKENGGARSEWFPLGERGFREAIRCAHTYEEEGRDVYFGVNPRPRGGRDDASVASAVALWVDLDGLGGEPEAWERLQLLRAGSNAPDCAAFTGGGLHAYWVLRHPVPTDSEDVATYLRALRTLCEEHCGDSKCTNISRIMRFPGTLNQKRGVRSKAWVSFGGN